MTWILIQLIRSSAAILIPTERLAALGVILFDSEGASYREGALAGFRVCPNLSFWLC
jgi:hypothetical protein